MARVVITSGPTRQYLDPVRYLTNASSGRMGAELARVGLQLGHEIAIITGPVAVEYPQGCRLVEVVTTEDMLAATHEEFRTSDGLIGVAAPCDYRPRMVQPNKIPKNGEPLLLELVETEDIVASVAAERRPDQWVVGFALETEDVRHRAIAKMQRKRCDLMVSNSAAAINAAETSIEILAADGHVIEAVAGTKALAAERIWAAIATETAKLSPSAGTR